METYWPFLLKDLGAFFIVNLCLILSAFGSVRLLRPLLKPSDFASQSIGLAFSLIITASVFFMIILAHMPLPVVGIMAVFFAGLQILGLIDLIAKRAEWASYFQENRAFLRITAFFFFVTLIFWTWILRDVAGFTSQADGIAHTNWFLRIIDSGNPLLNRTPLAFAEEFGRQTMAYYPTGFHGLMASYFGWMVSIGLLSGAQVLKGVLLSCGAWTIPFLLISLQGFFDGKYKNAVIWAVGIAALTWIPFPTTMIDNGGISRLAAWILTFPLTLSFLQRIDDKLFQRIGLAVAVSGAFMMHPGPTGLLGVTVAFSFLVLLTDGTQPFLRRLKEIGIRLVCFTIGAAPILYVLASNKATDLINELRMQGTYWERVGWRLKVLFEGTLQPDITRSAFYFDIRLVLFIVALGVLFLPTRIAHLRPRFRIFAYFSLISGVVILLCSYTEFKVLRLLGSIYYGDQLRMRDMLFPGFALIWGMGFAGLLAAWKSLQARDLKFGKAIAYGFALLAAGWTIDNTQRGLVRIRKYIEKQNIAYNSPRRSQNEGIIDLIRANVEKDAMIIAPPYMLDSVESRTGRKSVWVFLQCFAIETTEACKKREALIADTQIALKTAVGSNQGSGEGTSSPFAYLDRYKRPVYIVEVASRSFEPGQRLASDVEFVGSANGMMLYRFIHSSQKTQKSAEN